MGGKIQLYKWWTSDCLEFWKKKKIKVWDDTLQVNLVVTKKYKKTEFAVLNVNLFDIALLAYFVSAHHITSLCYCMLSFSESDICCSWKNQRKQLNYFLKWPLMWVSITAFLSWNHFCCQSINWIGPYWFCFFSLQVFLL